MSTASPDENTIDWASLREWERGLDSGTRERGANEVKSGQINRLDLAEDRISGVVSAPEARPYRAVLTRNPRTGTWSGSCDCPVGVSCKHAVAVALTALASSPAGSAAENGAGAAARTGSPLDNFVSNAADALGRDLTRKETLTLLRIIDAYKAIRDGESPRAALEAAIFQLIGADFATANRLAHELMDTRAESPEALLANLVLTLQGANKALPAWMNTVLARTGAGIRLAQERETLAVREWRKRLASLAETDTAEPAPDATAELRLRRISPRFIRWEIRDRADAPWRDLSAGDCQRVLRPGFEPRSLFTFDAAPLAELFRRTVANPARPAEYDLGQLREHGAFLSEALASPRTKDHTVEADGKPLTRHAVRLVWGFLPSLGKPGYARAELVREDGAPTPHPLLNLGRRLFLADDGLYRGPKPLGAPPNEDIPLAAFDDPAVERALRQVGAVVAPKPAGPAVAITPCIRATLTDDLAVITLVGLDPRGRTRLVPAHNGWRSLPVDGATTAGIPDTGAIDTARRHFITGPGYEGEKLTLLLDPHTVPLLADWMAEFPSGTRFELPDELAALVRPADRAVLAAELQAEGDGTDWFDLKLVLRPEDAELSKADLKLLMAHAGQWVRIPGKGWRRLVAAVTDEAKSALNALGLDASHATPGERLRFHAAQLSGDRAAALFDSRTQEDLRRRSERIQTFARPALPKGLKAKLRPYQHEGFHFLAHLSANGLGGLLADDMGLGKTLQTLTWLLWLKETANAERTTRKNEAANLKPDTLAPVPDSEFHVPRFLVIAPKSVVSNWSAEAAKFAPGLSVAIHGVDSAAACAKAQLVITNYVRLRLASEAFLETDWTAVVLDEGQHIKNPSSQIAEAVKALKARHRLILSGTPVENKLLDLWSLFSFAMPGLLGIQAAFKRQYDEKKDKTAASRLATRVRPFLLRRTKTQVATDLPERVEEDLVIELEPAQRKLYDAELKKVRAMLLDAKTARDFDKSRFNILSCLLRLRQICCDPRLVTPKAKAADSAKLDALWELLEPLVQEGHKVLVFSQFTEVLGLIGEKLTAEAVPFLKLTGATENRAELVERFQNPDTEKVFLLSLKAAGTGLNLTAASYVVLFDPWWNPAAEAQAIDRTHRIGQKNKVIAYRLIAKGTVEEKIRALQHDKAALAGEILQEESLAKVLDIDTLRGILAE